MPFIAQLVTWGLALVGGLLLSVAFLLRRQSPRHGGRKGNSATSIRVTWYLRADAIDPQVWTRYFAAPREGLSWYAAIEAGCTDPGEYSYGLIHKDTTLIGLIPAFAFNMPLDLILPPDSGQRLQRSIARLFGIRQLRIFFVGNVAGEEGHVGLDPGVSLQSMAAQLHDAARARARSLGARLLVWKDFTEADTAALDSLCASRRAFRMPSFPGSEIPLVPGGYAAFLQTQKSARRHKIKRKLSLGEAALPVNVRFTRHPTPNELKQFFQLFQQTYERGEVKFEHLSETFFHTLAQADETCFVVMDSAADGQAVAFMLLLKWGDRIINRFVGIDYQRGNGAYLPFRLFVAAYDWAAGTGARIMQSGQTGYSAKLDLGHTLVPLFNYVEHDNQLVNAILALASRTTTWETLDPSLADHVRANRTRCINE